MLVHEALGYNRFGLRCISREEFDARWRFVMSRDFSDKATPFHKPLSSYQTGKLSLPALVAARHEDEMARLKEEYKDFFKFPESPEFQSYHRQAQELEQDYRIQKDLVNTYKKNIRFSRYSSMDMSKYLSLTAMLASAGALAIHSKSPFANGLVPFLAIAAVINLYSFYKTQIRKKEARQSNVKIKMLLEDWHENDPTARYDRMLLNESLKVLDRAKPTLARRDKKRALVAKYRADHPRIKE